MKVLLVTDYGALRGGSEIVTFALRDGLRARGHDVRIFSSTATAPDSENLSEYKCFGTMSALRAALWIGNPSALINLKSAIADFKPDIVHVRLFLSQLSPLILTTLKDVPAVYHDGWFRTVCPTGLKVLPDMNACSHDAGLVCATTGCVPALAWPLSMAQLALWNRWKSVFNQVVANSHAVAEELERSGLTNVEVVYNGIPTPAQRPPLADPPTISFAGRLSKEKGCDILLDAYEQILTQVPEARLLIAGDGPERSDLQAKAKGICGNIRFLGALSRPEVHKACEKAWVHVAPSRGIEAFGNTAAEAMLRGTAAIASNCGGYKEYVRNEKTGLLVEPGDTGGLATALLKILKSKSVAEQYGANARVASMEMFDPKRFLDRFETIYESAVSLQMSGGAEEKSRLSSDPIPRST